jgi:hypothetical protein
MDEGGAPRCADHAPADDRRRQRRAARRGVHRSGQTVGGSGGGERVSLAEWIDYAYGLLATVNGLDEGQIDRTTIRHFRRLERYWVKHPPLHVRAAAYWPLKPPRQAAGEIQVATKISPYAGDFPTPRSPKSTSQGGLAALVGAGKDGNVGLEALVAMG